MPWHGLYLGYKNKNRSIVTRARLAQRRSTDDMWEDEAYRRIFGGTQYAPYMQGAGYVLSRDLVAIAAHRAAGLPELPPIEDALIGALVGPNASITRHDPSAVRFRNTGEYATSVCESDTSFVLVHKLSIAELEACHAATAHRRSSRCPKGPCQCRSLGVRQEGRRRVLAYPTPTPATAGGERATSRALTVHHETRRLLFGGRGEGAWGGREWQAGHDTGLREDSISFRPSSSRRLISKFHSRGRD
mmetsp:Transcript_1974/g.6522  ORF Transcript_1974/g.6522 Transcript_1974/m.6522 type:complete len:246 (-) Transcript_1974:13-750(-)